MGREESGKRGRKSRKQPVSSKRSAKEAGDRLALCRGGTGLTRKENPHGPCRVKLCLGGPGKVALVTRRMLACPKGGSSGRTRMEVR